MNFPKLQDLHFPKEKPWLRDNTLYVAVHGSHCYGLANELSDIDIRGVALRPARDYLVGRSNFEQQEMKGEFDAVIFDFHKFVQLAEKGNPNVLEILFVNEEHVVHQNHFGELLRANRELFLSKKIRHTLSGYAISQLKRIQGHYRWLKNPPTQPPTREELGLPSYNQFSKDKVKAAFALLRNDFANWDFDWQKLDNDIRINLQNVISDHLAKYHIDDEERFLRSAKFLNFDDNFIEILKLEREYAQKVSDWDAYQHWLSTRNEKRAALEAKFGYDTKHASHLVRLMKMCEEVLKTGKLNVNRSNIDAEELLAIKNNGSMSYEQLIEWADKQEEKIRILFKFCEVLPNEPNKEKIDNLVEQVVGEHVHSLSRFHPTA